MSQAVLADLESIENMINSILKSDTARSTLIVFLGGGISAFLAFFVSAVFARWLGPGEFGLFSSVMIFMNLLIQMSDLGTGKTVIRMAAGSKEFGIEKNDVYVFGFYLRAAVSIVLALSAFFASDMISAKIFENRIDVVLIKMTSIGIFMGSVGQTFVFMMQEQEDFISSSANKVLMAVTKALGVLLILTVAKINIVNALLLTITAFLVGIIHSFRYAANSFNFKHKIRYENIQIIFKYFRWMTVVQVSSIALINAPGIILTLYADTRQIGYYFAAYNLTLGLSILAESLLTVLLPKVSKEADCRNLRNLAQRVTSKLLYIALPVLVVMMLSGVIIKTIYGDKYDASIAVFHVLMMATLLDIVTIAYATILYRIPKIRLASYESLFRICLLYGIGIFMVNRYGALGVAYTVLGCSVMSAGFRYIIVNISFGR